MATQKHIAILGGGESGWGAALLAQKMDYHIWLSDGGSIKETYRAKLLAANIPFEEGGHNYQQLNKAQVVVKSPGIPAEADVVQKLKAAGKEIISEVEWAYRHCQGKIVAITGTNGKTTTCHLVYHILKNAGKKVALVGNVGYSFSASVANEPHDYYALEVSSFQLDDIVHFKPKVAILLNLSPDHLERYQNNLQNYYAAKYRITQNQDHTDYLLTNYDDQELHSASALSQSQAQHYFFSLKHTLTMGAYPNHGALTLSTKNQENMSIEELSLQGKHNRYNSMAAGLATRLLHIRKETIRESLANFENIEHRLEPVLEIYGIRFINDSKATNVNSTWYALESMPPDTIWIAGGVDKGNDYRELQNMVKQKVKALICIGDDTQKLHAAFGSYLPLVIDASNLDEAVRMAYKMGVKGDTVLLSPACASFDQFENYEDRGRQFKQAVRSL
jgi:UDP-N-acetylmuramoylalanine--D-glutamate ligase